MKFITLMIFVNSAIGRREIDDSACITPFRGTGSCVNIYSCEPIVQILKTLNKSLTVNATAFLKRYHCGFDTYTVKICCPEVATEIEMFRIVNGGEVRNKKPIPPDVSSHKNINLLPRDCGNILTNGKILNGNQTSQYEFPWQALLSYGFRNGPQFQCGGTVINNRYILTAAHCITGIKYPLIGVRVGEHNLLTKPDCETIENKINCAPDIQDMIIESVIPHPLYNRTALINDIGLIRLAFRMNFVESVAPICLPISREAANYDFSGRKGIVTGFGTTEKGVKSMVLLKVYVPYVEQSVCKKVYEKRTRITHLHLCAGGQNQQDSCGGDSGGPLQVALDVDGEAKYVQHGIVSFGPRLCGSEGYPGVYTRVPYYMDWILDNISF